MKRDQLGLRGRRVDIVLAGDRAELVARTEAEYRG